MLPADRRRRPTATRPRRSATGSRRPCSPTASTTARTRRTATPTPDYTPVNDAARRQRSRAPTMNDPNRWQPLQLEHMISQNGIPVVNGVQQAVGPHWGHVHGLRACRPAAPTASRSIPGRRRASAIRRRTRPTRTRPSRSSATAASSTPAPATTIDISPGVARQQHARARNDGTGHAGQSGDRPAVRGRRRQAGRLRARAGRVLGGRPEVGDAARPLERHRQRRVRRARRRTCGSAARARPSTASSGT